MRVLVLGGYGLIGSSIVRSLIEKGHAVSGLGRSAHKGQAVSTQADWIAADIAKLTSPEDWADIVTGFDVVVNAAGTLQAGLSDNVIATQQTAMIALVKACEAAEIRRFIQISAPGVSETSDTDFYRTKARADTALKHSTLSHVIFRPGLVISAQAYGGTSLLRMLAAFPVVQPLILARTPIQTVWVEDVASAVCIAVEGGPETGDFDLVASTSESLGGMVAKFRRWLGFQPARLTLTFPVWLSAPIVFAADISGWLGWRSALRSTSLKVLKRGIEGDGTPWEQTSGQTLSDLETTLSHIPSTAQERIYARAMLAFPVMLLTLSLFWIASGLIGVWQAEAAKAVLGEKFTPLLRSLFVYGGSLSDILIGLALLFRPLTRTAAFASILLSGAYLLASAVITPHLWTDPLGPMVKVFPAIALAIAVAAIAERR